MTLRSSVQRTSACWNCGWAGFSSTHLLCTSSHVCVCITCTSLSSGALASSLPCLC